MRREIRLKVRSGAGAIREADLPREFAEQVKFLADDPYDGLLWSDVVAHLRGGLRSARRLLSQHGAH